MNSENNINYLLKNRFSLQKSEFQIKVLNSGRFIPSTSVAKLTQKDGSKIRKISPNHFKTFKWLTYSTEENKLYCFDCLLFCTDNCVENQWCKTGYKNLKNIMARGRKHQNSRAHLRNAMKLSCFEKKKIQKYLSKAYNQNISKHNEMVSRNRYILKRIVGSVTYLVSQELAFRANDESKNSLQQGNYLELLKLLAEFDSNMENHLANSKVFKGTSVQIQNDVITSIHAVMYEEICRELNATKFVGIQVDEATDISCHCQCTIILRYIYKGNAVQRFLGFQRVYDRSAKGIAAIIFKTCEDLNINEKIISQTYDGASVMSGKYNGVQELVKAKYPKAHYIHCFAHRLNLVIQQSCTSISKIKLFFSNVMAIHSFFTSSSKRSDLFESMAKEFKSKYCTPVKGSQTRWSLKSRAVFCIYASLEVLECVFSKIVDHGSDFDDKTLHEAAGFLKILDDFEFNFILNIFQKIMLHSDVLYSQLQTRTTNMISHKKALASFTKVLEEMRTDFEYDKLFNQCVEKVGEYRPKRQKLIPKKINALMGYNDSMNNQVEFSPMKQLYFQVIDTLTNSMKNRFEENEHLSAFAILDEEMFSTYKIKFPRETLDILLKFYPGIFDSSALVAQLTIIYDDIQFHLPAKQLVDYLHKYNLYETLGELSKLLELHNTIPLTTVEAERSFSTLNRIKTSLRNKIGQEKLSHCCLISIEKDIIDRLKRNGSYYERVMDEFIQHKNRRAEFQYKEYSSLTDMKNKEHANGRRSDSAEKGSCAMDESFDDSF